MRTVRRRRPNNLRYESAKEETPGWRRLSREADFSTAHQTMGLSGASVEMTVFGKRRGNGFAALDNPPFSMRPKRMGHPVAVIGAV
jgi:hypothetical protein